MLAGSHAESKAYRKQLAGMLEGVMQRVLKPTLLLAIVCACTVVFVLISTWRNAGCQQQLQQFQQQEDQGKEPQESNSREIPKIIHYVFKNHQVFEAYKPLIRSCLEQNPDWKVLLWRDTDSTRLIQENYKYYFEKYKNYNHRLEKSDAVRYAILHHIGGIYMDMDTECLRPFDRLLKSTAKAAAAAGGAVEAFLSEERHEQTRILHAYPWYAMNSLMGSRPGHPFFREMIHRMKKRQSQQDDNPVLSTGPDLLTKVYKSWLLNCPMCQAKNPVVLFPARLVSPQMNIRSENFELLCQLFLNSTWPRPTERPGGPPVLDYRLAWRAQGCADMVINGWQFDETDDNTVAVHKFLHLGYGKQNWNKTFNFLEEFPRVKTFYPL